MARSRPTLTLVRRAVGGAAVLFLLSCAVVFYREAPSFSSFASSPSTTAAVPASPAPTGGGTPPATPGGPSSSADPSQAPSTTTTSAGDNTGSGPEAKEAIQLSDPPNSAKPFQTIPIRGIYRGAVDTLLRVELWERGTWQAFPLPTRTDRAGRFTAYVELGRPGQYRLRVLDPDSGVTSKPFVLVIKG